jgi:predicted ATPase
MVAHLTTEQRLQLVKNSPSAENEHQESSVLQALYNAGKKAEQLVSHHVKEHFGKEVALDFTSLRQLYLRVGTDFSSIPEDPRDAKEALSSKEKLDDQGNGIRSAVGIMTSLIAVRRDVFLIDEPEAFLHPPQAFRMGRFIAEQAGTAQLIVATHSADFLRGLLSSGQDMTVLRIDRENNVNSFNILSPDDLQAIRKDALLSSARVLEGLFYNGGVVVEGDRDSRFYQAVSNKKRPEIDLHFVNADNKQTVSRIRNLYRKLGVRCVGIVDFDVLNSKNEFKRQLGDLGLTEEKSTARRGLGWGGQRQSSRT